jgi:hypothetical protein
VDLLTPLLVLQVQHLHHDASLGGVVDLADQEDDPILEQQLVDGHLAGALVLHGRDRIQVLSCQRRFPGVHHGAVLSPEERIGAIIAPDDIGRRGPLP